MNNLGKFFEFLHWLCWANTARYLPVGSEITYLHVSARNDMPGLRFAVGDADGHTVMFTMSRAQFFRLVLMPLIVENRPDAED
jgi:hypothetical protein